MDRGAIDHAVTAAIEWERLGWKTENGADQGSFSPVVAVATVAAVGESLGKVKELLEVIGCDWPGEAVAVGQPQQTTLNGQPGGSARPADRRRPVIESSALFRYCETGAPGKAWERRMRRSETFRMNPAGI